MGRRVAARPETLGKFSSSRGLPPGSRKRMEAKTATCYIILFVLVGLLGSGGTGTLIGAASPEGKRSGGGRTTDAGLTG